jgi:hypothetical protein
LDVDRKGILADENNTLCHDLGNICVSNRGQVDIVQGLELG